MAIEDAYAVAACLSRYVKEPMAVLGRYQDVRFDCTAAVVRKAHENGKQAFSLPTKMLLQFLWRAGG
jgi:2-polyprenyl-6-methoxyphenol hydroxylase-like FAD-dependent oxidoreductase